MVRRVSTRRSVSTIAPESNSAKSYSHLSFDVSQERGAYRCEAPALRPTRKKRSVVQRLRRRLEPVVLSLAALVAFVGLGCSFFSSAHSSADLTSRPFSTVSVTVAPGDTLWSLAQRYEDPALRPADRIDLIRQANPNLKTASALSPGQTLLVPVTSSNSVSEVHLAELAK